MRRGLLAAPGCLPSFLKTKDLSMPGMVAEMRRCFERIEDGVSSRGVSLSGCLMSGLAIFALKYPSLLRFDRDARGLGEPSAREGNLCSLFGIGRAPSDSRMRERLDALDPEELRRPFKRLFAKRAEARRRSVC